MCGIAGSIGLGKRDSFVIHSLEIQNKRGPDNTGFQSRPNFSLGHNRLSIVDLNSSSNQPLHKNGIFIVFNGEIYNWKTLKESLLNEGVEFTSHGDTEVVLEMYNRYGSHFVDYLIGMYAIAIIDENSDRLILARDKFGQKPIYYTLRDKNIDFASDLRCMIDSNTQVSREGILDYLQLGYVRPGLSILKDVYAVLPGEVIVLESLSNPRVVDVFTKELTSKEKEEADNMPLDLLMQKVLTETLECDVESTVLLSGGLDSSLLLAMASKKQKNVPSFNVKMPKDSGVDESEIAFQIANFCQSDMTSVNFQNTTFQEVIEFIKSMSEPLNDSSIIAMNVLFKHVALKGFKVAVGGDGADELFYGYKHYERLNRLKRIPRPFFSVFGPYSLGLFNKLLKQKIPERYIEYLGSFKKTLGVPITRINNLRNIVRNDFLSDYSFETGIDNDRNVVESHRDFDLNNYLAADILRKADISSMHNSIELRSPFLDDRIAYKVLGAVNTDYPGERKKILREIAKEYLPSNYDIKRKQGFLTPISQWLENEENSRFIWSMISKLTFIKQGYLTSLSKDVLKNQSRHSEVFGLLVLSVWLETHMTKANLSNIFFSDAINPVAE